MEFGKSTATLPTFDISDRLYTTPKWIPKKEKGPEDSLVCDLPSTTLRWMKKRRKADSDQKVVLSFQRERQLREMFESLDYTNQGEIDLSALTDAVAYVQEKTKHMKGMKEFHNLQEVFAAMDDNGDGTIDFQEFTNGMTGTTRSAFDKASEYDIERVFRYFVEFGELRQRQIALKKLNANAGSASSPKARRPLTTTTNREQQLPAVESPGKFTRATSFKNNRSSNRGETKIELDLNAYQQFKVLFGNNSQDKVANTAIPTSPKSPLGPAPNHNDNNKLKLSTSRSQSQDLTSRPQSPVCDAASLLAAEKANAVEIKKLKKLERLLDDFIQDTTLNTDTMGLSSKSSHLAYPMPSPDHHHPFDEKKYEEYLQIEEKLKEHRKEEYELLGKHYNDAIFMEQRAVTEKKVLRAIQTPQSQAKLKASLRSENGRHLPALSISQELNLRSKARKDAFEILRTSSTERKNLLSAGSSFGYSSSLVSSWKHSADSTKVSKLASDSVSVLSESMSRSLTRERLTTQQSHNFDGEDIAFALRNSFSVPLDLKESNPYFDFGRSNSMPYLKD
mmetsp:Transcript_6833/g.7452  ORF Transcript_6833/g.7452 Transcript_6833/m.7452 type:complete len:563 (+) Transcript_6833:91-1779(+)